MKITYLNPENMPLEKVPAGWMLKTELHPTKAFSYKTWIVPNQQFEGSSTATDRYRGTGEFANWTYITQLPLPPDYLFDFDGTGLSFDDPNYRAAVEKAWKDEKMIQYGDEKSPEWTNCAEFRNSTRSLKWELTNYRIHPKHAADYGLSPIKIEQMLQREGKPATEPKFTREEIFQAADSARERVSASKIPVGIPPIPPSPDPGCHWEYRTPEQANGKECNGKNWMHYNSWQREIEWFQLHPAVLVGASEHYLELVADAAPCAVAEPDTDSPEYWSTPERQRELRIQWANDPEMERQVYQWTDKFGWVWNDIFSDPNWISKCIYRPTPKPFSQDERDRQAYADWFNSQEQIYKNPASFKAWEAGVAHGRSGK